MRRREKEARKIVEYINQIKDLIRVCDTQTQTKREKEKGKDSGIQAVVEKGSIAIISSKRELAKRQTEQRISQSIQSHCLNIDIIIIVITIAITLLVIGNSQSSS